MRATIDLTHLDRADSATIDDLGLIVHTLADGSVVDVATFEPVLSSGATLTRRPLTASKVR